MDRIKIVGIEGLESQRCGECEHLLYDVVTRQCANGSCAVLHCGWCDNQVVNFGLPGCPACYPDPPSRMQRFQQWINTVPGSRNWFRITAVAFIVFDLVMVLVSPGWPTYLVLGAQTVLSVAMECWLQYEKRSWEKKLRRQREE